MKPNKNSTTRSLLRLMLFALVGAVLTLTGCSSSPVSGRSQFMPLPGPLGGAQSNILVDLGTYDSPVSVVLCAADLVNCADEISIKFHLQVARIALELQSAAHDLYSQLSAYANTFDVRVTRGELSDSSSSASGRIALSVGLRNMDLSDDLVAFIIAREMGHVINHHHEENTSTGMLGSVLMGLVLPAQGLTKLAASLFGSRLGSDANLERQQVEADTVALKIMEHAGYPTQALALSLAIEIKSPVFSISTWAKTFRASALRVVALRQPPVVESREPALPVFLTYAL